MGAPISQDQHEFVVDTQKPGFVDITRNVANWLESIGAECGLITVFIRHTSASLVIQENADPAVQVDLMNALDRLAPRDRHYNHASEGPDDMPSHIRSMVTATSLQIPVASGRMQFGTWQAIYLIEHRDAPHRRHVITHYTGTLAGGASA